MSKVFNVWVRQDDMETFMLLVSPRKDFVEDYIKETFDEDPSDYDKVHIEEVTILEPVVRVTKTTVITSFSYSIHGI